MPLFKESLERRLPTLRQWLSEATNDKNAAFCHVVETILLPNKFPEYCFITNWYRYNVKASPALDLALLDVTKKPEALLVVAELGDVELEISSRIPNHYAYYNAGGTWLEERYGWRFELMDGYLLPTEALPFDLTGSTPQTKRRSKSK